MYGVHLIHMTHVVHLMHGIDLMHRMMHGTHLIHPVAPSVRRHSSLWHIALLSHTVAPVHGHPTSWAHVHLLVGVVHTHGLRPHAATTTVPPITIMLPTKIQMKTEQ